MNRWGNDDHGPGGDPSWLGGGDRGGEDSQGGWSSGFASDAEGSDSDVGRSDSDFGRSDSDFGRSDSDFAGSRGPRAAEQMAPRFGDRAGDGPLPSDRESSSWTSSFTGQDSEGSRSGRSTLSRVLGAAVPILSIVVFGIIALRIFGGGHGFGGMGMWWVLVFVIPVISRVVSKIRKHLDD